MPTILQTTIRDVMKLTELTPGFAVNAALNRLVNAVISGSQKDFEAIDLDTRHEVQRISAQAEMELECFWAKKIIDAPDPRYALSKFPYLPNYIELVKRERALLGKTGLILGSTHSLLMIGSGPLPLTSLELSRQSGARVDNVDSSGEAIDFCQRIGSVLKSESTYYHTTGQNVYPDKTYDVILIAALAGSNIAEKQAIIDHVLPFLKPDGRVILRSAHGIRELLYPAIEPAEVKGLTLLTEHHPSDSVINSILLYEKGRS